MTRFIPSRSALLAGGLILLISGCVGAPEHRPTPAPQPAPKPAPAPQPPLAKDWKDWPVAQGDWTYQQGKDGSIATFAQPGKPIQLIFRCEIAGRRIHVLRTTPVAARPGSQMTVYTSFGSVQWPIAQQTTVSNGYVEAIRAANDSALDNIAFTRGRFAIEVPGAPAISVPEWAEVARVVEDCRG